MDGSPRGRVLVLGIYLGDRPNTTEHLVASFAAAGEWSVEQRWLALGSPSTSRIVAAVTVGVVPERVPKFTLLNRMLLDARPVDYDYLIVADDDITLPEAFLDRYLAIVARHGFALAQPARTHDSTIDHRFVEQLDGLTARRTLFVEIGPLFSMSRQAVRVMTPFDEQSPMGWGYDLIWPRRLADHGLTLGIVDATPVQHRMRPPVAEYAWADVDRQRRALLADHDHLQPQDAFFIIDSHA